MKVGDLVKLHRFDDPRGIIIEIDYRECSWHTDDGISVYYRVHWLSGMFAGREFNYAKHYLEKVA